MSPASMPRQQASRRRLMARPNTQDILIFVQQVIAEVAGIPPANLTVYTDLLEDLELDSLALYEIVIELEEKYDLQISDEEIDKIKTIGDIVQYIDSRLR